MKKLLISLLSLFIAVDAIAERPTPQCIEDSKEAIVNKVKEIAGSDLTQEYISNNVDDFFVPVSEIIRDKCMDVNYIMNNPTILKDVSQIPTIKIPFQDNSKYYELNISSTDLLNYITIPTLILVTKTDLKKQPGQAIKATEMPKDYFFNEYCSDHELWFSGLDDAAPVNVAGQAAFPGYSDDEFYIDFPIGSGTRAFPGLIISNTTTGSEDVDRVLWFKNFAIGNKAAQDFAKGLQGSKCSNDNLQVYVVTVPRNSPYLSKPLYYYPQAWGLNPVANFTAMFNLPSVAVFDGQLLEQVFVLAGPYLIK